MKLVVQRVSASSVSTQGRKVSAIGRGLMILFGAEKGDDEARASFLAEKAAHLRIFPDEAGKMNRSCVDIGGQVLVVSQFTLAGDCSRGRRPGFDRAAPPDIAEPLYRFFMAEMERFGLKVSGGVFGADMQVAIDNDGPVTFILEK